VLVVHPSGRKYGSCAIRLAAAGHDSSVGMRLGISASLDRLQRRAQKQSTLWPASLTGKIEQTRTNDV
jgi:hypothetical protein